MSPTTRINREKNQKHLKTTKNRHRLPKKQAVRLILIKKNRAETGPSVRREKFFPVSLQIGNCDYYFEKQ